MSGYGRIQPIPSLSEIWILAGGPSARAFDLSRVSDQFVLAVNDAFSLAPAIAPPCAAVAVCSVDPHWIRRHRDFLTESPYSKYFAVPLETWPDCGEIPHATYLQRSHEPGLSDKPEYLCTGGNSGYAAINVAYLLGARTIHLVGYDMNGPEDKYRQWIPRFRTMLPQLEARGIEVINHNPQSAIDCFSLAA